MVGGRSGPFPSTEGSDATAAKYPLKNPKPESQSALIVLRGDFNPAILQPSWLASRDLITEELAEGAEVRVITQDVTAFDADWFSFRVTKDQFVAYSGDPSRYLFLADLVIGVFRLLEFTPLKQLGLNRRMHFKADSEARWHELGDAWAPKEPWKALLVGGREDGSPGLRSLTIEGNREDSRASYVRTRVEPSNRVRPGIFFETNEHYELAKEDDPLDALEVIESEWADAQRFSETLAAHVLYPETK